jgi:hypothetical protein
MSTQPPSTSNAAPPSTSNATVTTTSSSPQQVIMPSPTALVQAAKLALAQDKPILLDYYTDSYTGKAIMGEDPEVKEKMLVKSNEEFTSQIQNVYKIPSGQGDAFDYIVLTENSIYIVSGKMAKRRINAKTLKRED